MKTKTNSTQTIQGLVITLSQGHAHADQLANARSQVKDALIELHDESQAVSLITDVLSQAILQGHCNVIVTEGKRNDKTSNWKRDLAKAYNDAYESADTRLILKTSGKGEGRTVSVELKAKPVPLTGRDAFNAKLVKVLDEANLTEAEMISTCDPILALYDAEQDRTKVKQAKQQAIADEAKALSLEATTAHVSAQLEAKGFKATKANVEIALALTGTA